MRTWMIIGMLWGCDDKGETTSPADVPPGTTSPDTTDTADTADPCAGVPLVTYNSFGKGFMTENCQGCHASTTSDRYGAPESSTFDTVEEVWAQADRILIRAAGDDASMPPAGGVSEDDRTRLGWWLECAEEGT